MSVVPKRKLARDAQILYTMLEHPDWTKTRVANKFGISTTRLYFILKRQSRESGSGKR